MPGNLQDAESVYTLALNINAEAGVAGFFHVENLDKYRDVIIRMALCSQGLISPMCALLGGIVAQEVLKAASGIACCQCMSQVGMTSLCLSCIQESLCQ